MAQRIFVRAKQRTDYYGKAMQEQMKFANVFGNNSTTITPTVRQVKDRNGEKARVWTFN
ncbi:MAG: hypothetical protein WC346_17315 [Methanogenium sp.]|jgi:hypothetical protein